MKFSEKYKKIEAEIDRWRMNLYWMYIERPKYRNYPKPYGWMINDLIKSLCKSQANYLVGMGLFCYSEIIGREIMKYKNPKLSRFNNDKCFNTFFGDYMGYSTLLNEYGNNIYKDFRHGLCHEYPIKAAKSGIYLFYKRSDIDGFKKLGVDTTKGIMILYEGRKKYLIIEPYLKDFINGITKFLKETKKI